MFALIISSFVDSVIIILLCSHVVFADGVVSGLNNSVFKLFEEYRVIIFLFLAIIILIYIHIKQLKLRISKASYDLIKERENTENALSNNLEALKHAENDLIEKNEALEAINSELLLTQEKMKIQFDELEKSKDALKVSEERYILAVENSTDGIWDWDVEPDKIYYSPGWAKILGYKDGENFNTMKDIWSKLVHNSDLVEAKRHMRDHLDGKIPDFRTEIRFKTKTGEFKWIYIKGQAIINADGKLVRVAGSYSNVTERKKAEEKINYMTIYDGLTGLPNRAQFLKILGGEIEKAKQNNEMLAVLFLDLDNFKTINDTMGHTLGDQLLKDVTNVIKDCTRSADLVARIGGDEFIILQKRVNKFDEVTKIATRILHAFRKRWTINNREFYITTSIGIAIYPNDGENEEMLLKNADTATHRAKEIGKNNYYVYTDNLNQEIMEKLEIESNLRHAIKYEEFVIYYQPQIDISSGDIVGMEALIRWNHPELGIVPPLKFIPIAEESGLIIPIGEWVLRKACEQHKIWKALGLPVMSIAVNISARQFQQQNLVEMVIKIIKETEMDPNFLELEVTESIALQNMDLAVETLQRLKDMGIRLSLDDFGTGYSSLNYLKQLPINTLKIDKSFVDDITSNSTEEAIAKAVISIARNMRLNVVAEGVETKEQLDFLKEHGCDKAQGYLFSKPVPVDSMTELISKGFIN